LQWSRDEYFVVVDAVIIPTDGTSRSTGVRTFFSLGYLFLPIRLFSAAAPPLHHPEPLGEDDPIQ